MEFIPICSQTQLLEGEKRSATVIALGWTHLASVRKQLAEYSFAVAGQLYNAANGMEPLLRNLLYNPQISRIILLEATPQDKTAQSVSSAYRFLLGEFVEGKDDLGRSCWRSKEGNAIVPKMIDEKVVRERLKTLRVIRVNLISDLLRELQVEIPANASKIRQELPTVDKPKTTVIPTAESGFVVREKALHRAWIELLYLIRSGGKEQETHHGVKWQELKNLMVVIEEDFSLPSPNFLSTNAEFLTEYIAQVCEGNLPSGVRYTYGSRMRSWFGGVDQVQAITEKLKAEPTSASAVINLWDATHDHGGGSPCLNHLWFRLSEGRLFLTATFRSNDMFGAYPANAIALRALQHKVAKDIGSSVGSLTTVSQSAHIYEDCYAYVDGLIASRRFCRFRQDPAGFFIISWNDLEGLVEVSHQFPEGVICSIHKGKDPSGLASEIVNKIPHIQADHAVYLTSEIYRTCQLKTKYRQR